MRQNRNQIITYWVAAILIVGGMLGLLILGFQQKQKADFYQQEQAVITFAIWGDEEEERIVNAAAADFEKKENCTVEVYCFATQEAMREDVLRQFAAGDAYDVFWADETLLKLLYGEQELLELSDVVASRTSEGDFFYERALENGQLGEEQIALPMGMIPSMVSYNKGLLNQYEMDIPEALLENEQWTFEGFCQYLTLVKETTGKTAITLVGDYESIISMFQSAGGSWQICDQQVIPDETGQNMLTKLEELKSQGVIECLNSGSESVAEKLFETGETVMILGDFTMTKQIGGGVKDWDIIPVPSETGKFASTPFSVPMIAASAKGQAEEAICFIDYYVSTAGQKVRLESGECMIPSLQMVFYTSMGDVVFPEHSNYYFFALEYGFSTNSMEVDASEKECIVEAWKEWMGI